MAVTLRVSATWLRQQAQRESRVEHHAPRITLPIRKAINELGWWQRLTLRREAQDRRRTA
jgi:hypothetical protein